MKTSLNCIPCFIKQVLDTVKFVSEDPTLKENILREALKLLSKASFDVPPPKIAQSLYKQISNQTGKIDPYKKLKEEYNRIALGLYPYLKDLVSKSPDPLFTAIKIAAAGNIIDFGVTRERIDVDKELEKTLRETFSVFDYEELKKSFSKNGYLLYIGDNAGEVVFDRVLIEEIKRQYFLEVYFVVRGAPIINDATEEDALVSGIDKVATVVSSGCDIPGTIIDECTNELKKLFNEAPVILVKGQGNFETLNDVKKNIFFLLKAKCNVVADYLGVENGKPLLISQLKRLYERKYED